MPDFARYIGIDYSGAQTPTTSLKDLRIYLTEGAYLQAVETHERLPRTKGAPKHRDGPSPRPAGRPERHRRTPSPFLRASSSLPWQTDGEIRTMLSSPTGKTSYVGVCAAARWILFWRRGSCRISKI